MSYINKKCKLITFGKPLKIVCATILFLGALWLGRVMRDDGKGTPATTASLNTPPVEPLYTIYCATCHGTDGHGNSESAARLSPPPRDFAEDNWRFARTQQSIQTVIKDGIPGTAMPSMKHMFTDAQLDQLAKYVLHLSKRPPSTTVNANSSGPERLMNDMGFTVFSTPYEAPQLKLKSSLGEDFELITVAGKAVLLNFWGTTCTHCLKEMPFIAKVREQFAHRGLEVVSLCVDEAELELVKAAAAQVAPNHPVYCDTTGLASQKYGVTSLPTFVLIDRNHNVVASRAGTIAWDDGRSDVVFESLLNSE